MHDTIECALAGRVGQEPQMRTSQAGKTWLSFSIAVGSGETAQWVQVAAFGALAEDLADRLRKGDRAYVEGRVRLNTWTDKAGAQRAGLSVSASVVHPLGQIGRRRQAAKSNATAAPVRDARPARPDRTEDPRDRPFDDPIPYLGA